jgi:hypothetical protein
MKLDPEAGEEMSYWQCVFSRSVVNGAPYRDTDLPVSNWDWPKETYLQRRISRGEIGSVCDATERAGRESTA